MVILNDFCFVKHQFIEMLTAYFPEVDAGIPEDIIRGKLVELIQSQYEQGIIRICIAFDAGQAIGFSIFQMDTPKSDWCKRPGWGFIREFYIRPPFRGQGRGRELASYTELAMAQMGAKQMYLTSGSAIPFWKSCGWKETGQLSSNGLYILEK